MYNPAQKVFLNSILNGFHPYYKTANVANKMKQ